MSAHALTTSSPILRPSSLGHEDDVGRLALDLEVGGRVVRAQDLVDVADRDARGDGRLRALDEPGAVDRLEDDPVVLARGDGVLEQLDLRARVEVAIEHVSVALPAAAAACAAASIGAS